MAEKLTTTSEERGQQIVQLPNQIQRVDERFYTVKSQSGNGERAVYVVYIPHGQQPRNPSDTC